VLTCTCFVSGDPHISETFKARVREKIFSSVSKQRLCYQLKDDIQAFNVISGLDNVAQNRAWNLKRVVYRSTTLFIAALGRNYGICDGSSFQTIRELAEIGVFDKTFSQQLLHAVAIACLFRLIAYIEKDRQEDWVDSSASINEFIRIIQSTGPQTPVIYFETAMKLQRETCRIIGTFDTTFVQWSPHADKLLACFWLHQYEEALWEAEKLLYGSKGNISSLTMAMEVILAIGHMYFANSNFRQALRYVDRANSYLDALPSPTSNEDKAYCLKLSGRCHMNLQNWNEAVIQFRNELMIRMQSFGNRRETTECFTDLAFSLAATGQSEEALLCLMEARSLEAGFLVSRETSSNTRLAELENTLGEFMYKARIYERALLHYERAVEVVAQVDDNISDREKPKYFCNIA